jgi:hypothetical protein
MSDDPIKNILPEVFFSIDNQLNILRKHSVGLELSDGDLRDIARMQHDLDAMVDRMNERTGRAHLRELKGRSCFSCVIEADIGTEENPHPIPQQYHTCVKR